MAFDVAGAKQAGYSDIEIAEFLGQQKNFDVAGAIKSGYSPAELISYLGAAKPAQSKERTFGEAAADVGAGLVGGAGKLIQLPGQLYGLATGDFSETGSLGLGKKIEQAGEEMKSAGLKAREQERAEKIAEAEKKGQISAFGTALGETLKDPGLLLNFLAEQAPQLLVPFGAAKVGSALTAGRAGTRAAIGAGAVQQGADIGSGSYEDIYKELIGKGVSEADAKQSALNLARASGASGAVISLLAQKLPGAKRLEEAMAGVPSKTGRIRGAVGTAAGETLGEIPEEVGGKFTQNLAMREVKPEQELTAGLGETAAMAAIGGAGLGGAAGLARGRAKPEVQTIPEIPATEEIKAPPELQQLIDRVSGVSAAPEQQDLLTSEEANRQRINMLQQKVDEDAKLQEEKARSQGIPPSVPPSPPRDVSKPSLYETELPQATPQEELDTKQAEIDQLRLDAGLPTGASSKTPGVQPTTTTPEETLKPKIVDERPLQERAAKNRLLVLQNMLKNEGGDPNSLSIVPHPEVEGKFAIQSLDVPVKFQKDLKATASDRPESTPVIDPVNAYIEIAKRTNTPASMRLVKDFQEGIVTREDIEAAIEAERKANQPMPINYQGNGEPWFIAPVTYKPRGERVITEPIEEVDEVTEDPTVGEGVDPPTPTTEMPQTLGEFKLRMPAAFDNPDVRAANKNASFPDLMQALMQSKNPVIKRIGELGNQISNQVTLQKTKYLGNRYAGLYYPALDAIKISPKYAGDETTNAHETLHALIYRMQKNPTTKQKASVKKIEDLYQHVKRELAKQGMGWDRNKRKKKYAVQVYGLADQYEFAAEAMSNPEFQYMLMQIPYKGKKSAWSEFTRYVAELLGIKDTNALTEILNLVDKIAQTKRPARNYLSNKVVRNEVVYKEIEEAERETDQKPTKKGEENVARPDESTGGTGVQVPVRAANELPAAQGVKGTQQRGVASVGPTPAKPVGGAGIQPTAIDVPSIEGPPAAPVALGFKEVKEKVRGAFQKQKPISAEAMSDLDPSFVKALNKQFKPENKTFIDKAEGFKEDMWKKLAQGIADQYRSIKDYSEEAYMMARMSKSVDGALEGILFHGHVFNDGGALNIKQNTKGLIEAMKPLGKDVDRYQMWVALNRDARLPKEKRSFDPDLVAKRDQLAQGTLNGRPRLEVFKDVQGDMNALNRSVLDVAYKVGLINSDAYDIFSNDIFYIPFYKQMEDGDIQGASTASGLVGQRFSNQLKGGDKQLGDLMENTLRNWSHILSASMKNQAANETIKAAERLDAAEPSLKSGLRMENGIVYSIKNGKPIEAVKDEDGSLKYEAGEFRPELTIGGEKGTVKVMRNGDPTYFKVLDPMLLDSIMSIGYMGPKSKFLDVAKDFKNILQFGVTISPAFKVRNLFRDSISAIAVTDLKRNPFANVIEGWIASNKNNPAHISALAGGAIFNFGSTVEGDQAKLTKRLIEKGVREQDILDTPEKVKEGLKYIWDKYQEFGNKSESANRMALYNQLVKNGKTHLEASFYARDMLDFSMQGSFGTIRTLAQVVPFFNARVQGLYKLGRDGVLPTSRVIYNTFTGKPIEQSDKKKAESFSIVTGAVALASMALYLGFKDDEEFQKREAWDRDNFWWFRLPGMEYAIRIPKPFEVGAFGTIAERTLEQIIDQNAEGKQFGESLSRMLWDTFSMNPMPQVFKPLVDLYANEDSFTGAPIESAGMERLSKQERATDSTSPIAKLLGGMSTIVGEGVSPVQVDYAIKAYLGWLGGSIASMSTYAVAPFRDGEYPDVKAIDMVSQGFIKSLPSNQSRYVTSFYENNQQVNQAFADMRHYAELGDSEKVQKIMEEKGDLIALQKLYDKTAKNMANVRKQIRMITDDKEMDGATKREEIDRMKQLISMMAEQAESIRKSTKS